MSLLTVFGVTSQVAHRLDVPFTLVTDTTRLAHIVEARHWVWWLLVRRHGYAQTTVATGFGRDSSSVWHAVHKMDRRVRRGEVPESISDLVHPSTVRGSTAEGGPDSRRPSQPPRTLEII